MRILFLDDDENRHEYARRELIGHDVTHVRTAAEAIDKLTGGGFDLAMLDHDLGGLHYTASNEVSGYAVASAIADRYKGHPAYVLVHSYNPAGASRMVQEMAGSGVPCVWAPFGPTAFKVVAGFGVNVCASVA